MPPVVDQLFSKSNQIVFYIGNYTNYVQGLTNTGNFISGSGWWRIWFKIILKIESLLILCCLWLNNLYEFSILLKLTMFDIIFN